MTAFTLLEVIAKRIEDGQFAKREKDLFVNGMPANVHQGVGLVPPRSGNEIDHELPGYRKTTFQLVIRTRKYSEDMAKMIAITKWISVKETLTLEGHEIRYIRPKHDPIAYPLSDAGLVEISVNFDAGYVIVPQ